MVPTGPVVWRNMDYEKLKNHMLDIYPGKRVEEKQIRLSNNIEYNLFYELIMKLVDENVINPVKASGPNGLNPPLYKRYKVINSQTKTDYTGEIKQLHPVFNIEGYLQTPNRYSKDREIVQKLNTFLRNRSDLLKFPASVNERSFQIFQAEKIISSDLVFKSVLAFNNSLKSILNIYKTPEPFFEYVIDNSQGNKDYNVLIIENKDTWYTLKKIMSYGDDKSSSNVLNNGSKMNPKNFISGVRIDCLLYGEGKKITRKSDSLSDYTSAFADVRKNPTYYYFGDLDYEGISIFEKLVAVNKDLTIILMRDLYLSMLKEAGKCTLSNKSKKQSTVEGELFFSYFNKEEQLTIKSILEKGYYIPQEILGFEFFELSPER